MGFYNCGWDSGASQKHCHVQVIEVRAEDLKATSAEGSAPESEENEDEDNTSLIPIERLLSKIERDGSEHRELLTRDASCNIILSCTNDS